MERRIDIAIQLDTTITLVGETLADLEESFVSDVEVERARGARAPEPARVTLSMLGVDADEARWSVEFEPATSTGALPRFHGELRASPSRAGTQLRLSGWYALSDGAARDRIRAHVSACDALHAFVEDIAFGVDAATARVASPVFA